MTIVLPVALAAAVAFLVAISPLVTAMSVALNGISTTEKVVTDIKADVAKWKQKHKKKRPAPLTVKAPPR